MYWRISQAEDGVDRVNRLWTVFLLAGAALAAFLYMAFFPDSAVTCYSHKDNKIPPSFVNKFCLHDVDALESNSAAEDGIKSAHIHVPICLVIQIFGFLLPHVLANFITQILGEEEDFCLRYAEKNDAVTAVNLYSTPRKGLYITFMLKKLFFLINCIIQFIFVQKLFPKQVPFSRHPFPQGLLSVPLFPTVVKCLLKQNNSTHNYNCSFNINGVYSLFYICLYYWLLIVIVINLFSLLTWVFIVNWSKLTLQSRIKMYIRPLCDGKQDQQILLISFIKNHLGKDFVLNLLLSQSTNREVTLAELTAQRWLDYLKKRRISKTVPVAKPVEPIAKPVDPEPVEQPEPEKAKSAVVVKSPEPEKDHVTRPTVQFKLTSPSRSPEPTRPWEPILTKLGPFYTKNDDKLALTLTNQDNSRFRTVPQLENHDCHSLGLSDSTLLSATAISINQYSDSSD